jgi:uncharacterized protein YyaL (SSP411 family)
MLRFSPNPNRAHMIPWQEWSDQAFRAARENDKPLMLFLAAFWCRYCQRMDEEAFSETENIALLNAYFVPLRVENSQRPDVDARYNFNGWPTIAFMTPDGQLLGAVNYLPTEEFKNLLIDVYLSYQQNKGQLRVATKDADEQSDSTATQECEQRFASNLLEVTQTIMSLADRVHGGYGRGQKFIQAEANEFLLGRYEATGDRIFLDQACLTLDQMREGAIHDRQAGGYFRTTSGADWSQPHREKLLIEQAGLLANCLHAYRMTRRSEYAQMAQEIIAYLNKKLLDPVSGGFFGCEDFLRNEGANPSLSGEFFTIIDKCLYVDANAAAASAYLDAAEILGDNACKESALATLEFLWTHCRSPRGGMCHFYDGEAQVPDLLADQAYFGLALIHAHRSSGKQAYLDWAKELAEFIIVQLTNPAGGYFDCAATDLTFLKSRLTLVEANGPAASLFLDLAKATKTERYRDAARWALGAFTSNLSSYAIHAAAYASALEGFLRSRR